VQNTALVDVTIGGNNYAPINIVVRTVTTIVNAAKSVVETAAGGGPASGSAAGVGAKVTNRVSLDGTAAVDIAGDNHSPIKIVLDIGAELWNKGAALLGLGQGTGGPASASARGLEVENLLKLLGRASVRISGSNYAPIDIQILLQNLIYNEGTASAGSAGVPSEATTSAAAREVSSGAANCLSLLNTAGIVNGQVASVKLAEDAMRRKVAAGNTHVVDVQGYGTARCSTGDVNGSVGNASSGPVNVAASSTTLTVVSTQVADTSAKTDPAPDSTGQTVQVVIAVTTTPLSVPGKNSRGKIQHAVIEEEETWEWVVVWEPLYVIYTRNDEPDEIVAVAQSSEPSDSETTTSMAGSFRRPQQVVTPLVHVVGGLDLLSQIQLAALGLLAFLLLALLKRRLNAAEARRAALRSPELVVLEGGAEAAAD
jgi:hypothetical protein